MILVILMTAIITGVIGFGVCQIAYRPHSQDRTAQLLLVTSVTGFLAGMHLLFSGPRREYLP